MASGSSDDRQENYYWLTPENDGRVVHLPHHAVIDPAISDVRTSNPDLWRSSGNYPYGEDPVSFLIQKLV